MTCFSSSCRLLLTKKACLIYLSLEARLFRSAQVVWGKRLAWRPIHLIVGLTCVFFFFLLPHSHARVCVHVCVRVCVHLLRSFWFALSCHCGGKCRASHMKTRCAFFAFVSSKWVNILQCVLTRFLMCTISPFFSLFFPPYCDDEDNNYAFFFCHKV